MNAIPNYGMPNNFLSSFFVSYDSISYSTYSRFNKDTLLPGELNLFALKRSGASMANYRSTNEEFYDSVRMPRDVGRLCIPRRFCFVRSLELAAFLRDWRILRMIRKFGRFWKWRRGVFGALGYRKRDPHRKVDRVWKLFVSTDGRLRRIAKAASRHREKGEKEPSIYIHRVMALDRLNHRESIRISRCCYSQSRLASKCDVRLEALQDSGLSARWWIRGCGNMGNPIRQTATDHSEASRERIEGSKLLSPKTNSNIIREFAFRNFSRSQISVCIAIFTIYQLFN